MQGNPRKLRVAVLFGGRSAEHEISLLSARFVAEALDRERFEPVLIGIDKEGRWLRQEEALLLGENRDPRLARLNEAMPEVALATHPSEQGETLLKAVEHTGGDAEPIDVVFPVLHGTQGEDGSVQGLLELTGVPYVGSGVLGSAVGMDKDVMKRLLREAELPVLPHFTVRKQGWERDRAGWIERICALAEGGEPSASAPIFVKPANLGSSVGIRRVSDPAEVEAAVDHAFEFDLKVVCEQGLPDAREIECAVLGDEEPVASIPGEIVIDHADGFYSYAAKYIDERGATIKIPADLDPAELSTVQTLSLRVFRALEASGLARVDFLMSADRRIYVNEINTLPGFTAISMYPKLWEASGISPRELVRRLIELALERGERRRRLRTTAALPPSSR
ncbi:D-alanine--D-alanine ligase family protein [Chondromyces crocatus]|uniref:D-alanine--D-alanine ligase n=1 Tax=Chondromyces crocatus TaxID=52 RepID=A0A0K1E9J1_CHOCO|nr:D-alanine--D-alanine ligase family protein [Chondromyces crocatus]AKT37347.1 D-alanine--D-alanine ligase [Chondromyces crocatus]